MKVEKGGSPMKVVIVGGVAGGAGCAARLRRLDETAEIVILERGDYISYANCGLPYHVGNVIRSRDSLLVTPAQQMRDRFRVRQTGPRDRFLSPAAAHPGHRLAPHPHPLDRRGHGPVPLHGL